MSSENSPPTSPDRNRRRASFSPGQAFTGLFATRASNASQSPPPPAPYPGSIVTAAANAQQRRMSIATLGLSSSPTQSAFNRSVNRRGSVSSSGSGSPHIDEEAIEDGDGGPPNGTPTTPFGRRLSFGAQALRDVRVGSGSTNGEGLNWGEQLRAKARAPSFSNSTPTVPPNAHPLPQVQKPPGVEVKEPPRRKGPDALGERMLKGDFYMD